MTNKQRGCMLMSTGGLLLLAACIMGYYFWWEDNKAAQSSSALLEQITVAHENKEETQTSEQADTKIESSKPLLPEGCSILGIINIPKLNLELPVINECSDSLLKLSVCRYKGEAKTIPKKLIIAGHNYKSHFKRLPELAVNDQLFFTNASEETYTYNVIGIEEIDGDDVEGLEQGDWDLTLFTCNFEGGKRFLVRCRLES